MLFTYPIQAIENNWIHDCIQAALETICEALDTEQPIPAWPEVIPELHRQSLVNRRTLPERLNVFKQEADKVTIEDRAEFLSGFRRQNQIPELLAGTLEVPVFRDALRPLVDAATAVCNEGFSLLGKQALRHRHYEIIYTHLPSKTCPFCGLEPFDAPSLANEDEDHYLARSVYPMAAANFANLVPMGSKCNQRYKGKVDILHADGVRRRALNPYGEITIDITLINSNPSGAAHGRPSWRIDVIPDIEETRTWDQVFSIRERLTESVLNAYFDSWISELPDWFDVVQIDISVDDARLISELDRFVNYKAKHREQGAGFFKGKLFEFLAHHCRLGNEQVIAMIRSCLPNPLAA